MGELVVFLFGVLHHPHPCPSMGLTKGTPKYKRELVGENQESDRAPSSVQSHKLTPPASTPIR